MNRKKGKQPAPPKKIEVPFDIALSLTRPDELVKLKRYIDMYIAKYGLGNKALLQEREGM
jgi:hypothetical protein